MTNSNETASQRERRLAYLKSYNASHKEERRAYLKQWYQDNKEHVKETTRLYRLENAEKVREGAGHRYETNKEHWTQSRKAYYAINKAKILKKHKDRRATKFLENPKEAWLHFAFLGARSRAKKKGLPCAKDLSGLVLPDVCPVFSIPLKYGRRDTAASAAFDSPSLDRIVPKHGYVLRNLRVISYRANALKSDASIDELRRVLAYMEDCQNREVKASQP